MAAFAGHFVLSELYPGQQSKFDVVLQKQLGERSTHQCLPGHEPLGAPVCWMWYAWMCARAATVGHCGVKCIVTVALGPARHVICCQWPSPQSLDCSKLHPEAPSAAMAINSVFRHKLQCEAEPGIQGRQGGEYPVYSALSSHAVLLCNLRYRMHRWCENVHRLQLLSKPADTTRSMNAFSAR